MDIIKRLNGYITQFTDQPIQPAGLDPAVAGRVPLFLKSSYQLVKITLFGHELILGKKTHCQSTKNTVHKMHR